MVGKYIALLCFSAGDDWESLRQKVSQFVHDVSLQQFLECWLLSSLRTFCNFFLKITLKFSVLMLKSQ